MIEKSIIVVLGAGIILAVVLLLKLKDDQQTEICESRTIVFDWKYPDKPGECEIYAHPLELDYVRDCAAVVFVNQTDKDITIVFEKSKTGKLSPFLNINSISLEPNGDPNQFSKALPVTVELDDPDKFEDFPYHVELDKDPQTEQSPRIRIGPRSSSSQSGG